MNTNLTPCLSLILAFCIASAGSAGSSTADPANGTEKSPKIGLALAGGGARGIGHVGVIRLLEEMNIRVDYVAGTSMGAIVAGLYSVGYTSDEMEAWLEQCDWDQMLSDSLPREQRGYRAKAEELETPKWIEFGMNKSGLAVPNAFISGQNLLLALRETTDFVRGPVSFDDLPVPYRAVATDLETGEMVVLDHGPIADAMRASMAVPGIFAPYTIDGQVLIDGFASRNLPISIVRDMGADIVIAVDVRADLLPADELSSPISMVQQLISILSQRDTLDQIDTLTEADVLLRLKLPGFATSSFVDALEIAELGYLEALEERTDLARLSLPLGAYTAAETDRRRLQRNVPVIAAIEVEGSGRVADETIRKRLNLRPGEPLNPDQLQQSLGRVHDLGYFKSVDYRLEDRPDGTVLVVTTEPKPWGPNFLLFGLGLSSDVDGNSELNVRASLRFTQLNRLGAEVAILTSLGTIDSLDAEFFQPIDYSGTFFVAPGGEFVRRPEAFLLDLDSLIPGVPVQQISFQRQTLFGGLAGGMRLGTYGEFRVGLEYGSIENSSIRAPAIIVVGPDGEFEVVDLGQGLLEYNTSRAYASLTLDQLDDAFFPRHGYFMNAIVERESGEYGTTIGRLLATAPIPAGSFVFQPRLNVNYNLAEENINARLPFSVGGLFNLSGVPIEEIYGSNSMVGALIVRKRLGGGEKTSGIFLGGSIEAGNAWDDNDRFVPDDWIVAGSVFLAASTPLGPVHFAVGLADGFDPVFYFTLGRVLP